ncbi:hypothetical protein T440DRAFT_136757 [Plenodomus tracheiphilus IPT5]|uniref:Uncharacterized protein n=1 Tax=Plenodomus tracheiphilus IPT5 TaxID=1408161 RepID=A0A6A7B202_9PLEO|nr:hypothetical protein T440DRAFT_136757 [Plenodomus tracheiphilus IPT5]
MAAARQQHASRTVKSWASEQETWPTASRHEVDGQQPSSKRPGLERLSFRGKACGPATCHRDRDVLIGIVGVKVLSRQLLIPPAMPQSKPQLRVLRSPFSVLGEHRKPRGCWTSIHQTASSTETVCAGAPSGFISGRSKRHEQVAHAPVIMTQQWCQTGTKRRVAAMWTWWEDAHIASLIGAYVGVEKACCAYHMPA